MRASDLYTSVWHQNVARVAVLRCTQTDVAVMLRDRQHKRLWLLPSGLSQLFLVPDSCKNRASLNTARGPSWTLPVLTMVDHAWTLEVCAMDSCSYL